MDFYKFFERQNPFFAAKANQWRRNRAAYSGGKEYVGIALIRHLSEIEEEFAERKKRAYYCNWPRKIARIITQYVLSVHPERDNVAPEFLEDWSRTGLRTNEVMRQFSTMLNVYGCAWLAVDMPFFEGPKSRADELRERLRPYVTALSPLSVPDWCYGADGKLLWAITEETAIDNSDPFRDPQKKTIRKLWERDKVTVFTRLEDGTTQEAPPIFHALGAVPFVRAVEVDGYGMQSNHWFDDVVAIGDAMLNNESEAQMNAVKQMFGLLVVSESFVLNSTPSAEDKEEGKPGKLSSVIGRSAAVVESPEDKGITRYISPSGIENAVLRTENLALLRAMFETVGLATSKDTKMVESAEAKLWDFQNIEQYMRSRADQLEQCELQAWELLKLWQPTLSVPNISYNRNFAVLDLKESIAALLELSSFNGENVVYQKEVGKTALNLLNRLRQLPAGIQEEILKAIDAGTVSPNVDGAGVIEK